MLTRGINLPRFFRATLGGNHQPGGYLNGLMSIYMGKYAAIDRDRLK
jgi:hypothetical protein